MKRHVAVVAGSFAIMEDDEVIGVVSKMNETQWGFWPLVPGRNNGVGRCVPLQYALEAGLKFIRDSHG